MKAIVLHLLSIRSRKEPLRSLHLAVLFGESMLHLKVGLEGQVSTAVIEETV
jgi:hypothetical protein